LFSCESSGLQFRLLNSLPSCVLGGLLGSLFRCLAGSFLSGLLGSLLDGLVRCLLSCEVLQAGFLLRTSELGCAAHFCSMLLVDQILSFN
jgi:hypothetical protein